jgi:type I site-specific restriction-modification system R (restriction) subunit
MLPIYLNKSMGVYPPFFFISLLVQFKWENLGIKTRVDKNQLYLFDPYRKKYILATPEEEVRQFTLYQLVHNKGYPSNSIAVERQLLYNNRKKRFDILVYVQHKPTILIECKSADIQLSQKVFDQVSTYNFTLQVPYLLITNGRQSICAKLDTELRQHIFLEELPSYNSLIN